MTFYADCNGNTAYNNAPSETPPRCVCYNIAPESGVSGFSFLVSSVLLGKPIYGRLIQLHLYIAGSTKSDCAL